MKAVFFDDEMMSSGKDNPLGESLFQPFRRTDDHIEGLFPFVSLCSKHRLEQEPEALVVCRTEGFQIEDVWAVKPF